MHTDPTWTVPVQWGLFSKKIFASHTHAASLMGKVLAAIIILPNVSPALFGISTTTLYHS
jgi:hypothetical protein